MTEVNSLQHPQIDQATLDISGLEVPEAGSNDEGVPEQALGETLEEMETFPKQPQNIHIRTSNGYSPRAEAVRQSRASNN